MKNLNYYATKSLKATGSKAYECDLILDVDGEKFRAYEVSIAACDLLFFTEKGTLNYLVDDYGLNGVRVELFNVERD